MAEPAELPAKIPFSGDAPRHDGRVAIGHFLEVIMTSKSTFFGRKSSPMPPVIYCRSRSCRRSRSLGILNTDPYVSMPQTRIFGFFFRNFPTPRWSAGADAGEVGDAAVSLSQSLVPSARNAPRSSRLSHWFAFQAPGLVFSRGDDTNTDERVLVVDVGLAD
jgi:hypothetical protein